MKITTQLARQFREVYLEGQWVVGTNLKAELSQVNWKEATIKTGSLNTIAALAFHLGYYVAGVTEFLKGGQLTIRDQYSFDLPPIRSEEDWQQLLDKLWTDAEAFAQVVEALPQERLDAVFVKAEYGTYLRNIHAIIEHSYYHLGQIVLIRKMLKEKVL